MFFGDARPQLQPRRTRSRRAEPALICPAGPSTPAIILYNACSLGWKVWPQRRDCSVYLLAARAAARRTNCCARQSGSGSTALIICSSSLGAESAARLVNAHMPFVLAERCPAAAHFNACYVNFEEGAYRMARHLLELGRKRLWLLTNEHRPNVAASMLGGAAAGAARSRS